MSGRPTPLVPDPVDPSDAVAALTGAPMEVVGQVVDASNVALLVRLGSGPGAAHGIYKPIAGEQPLWDFPDGRLAYREVAAYLCAQAGGWPHIPVTVLRADGPFGPGSLQQWVTPVPAQVRLNELDGDAFEEDDGSDGEDGDDVVVMTEDGPPAQVRLWPAGDVPGGWHPIVRGEGYGGERLVLAHADAAVLRSIAVLDAALNNSDRKGSHLLMGTDGQLHCIDHGLTLHREDKLRTVLWGWAGEAIPQAELARLEALRERLIGDLADVLADLLTGHEVAALEARVEAMLRTGRHPRPSPDWPSVPWPPL